MRDKERNTGRQDWAIILLIGAAHACSHFYQLVLPPLFPFLKDEFGVGYTELGLMMSIYYGVSGCLQAPAGFVVDRIGATKVLVTGILLAAGSVVLFGLVSSYWMLFPLVVLAGVGNSVFHPSDYTILSASVSERNLSHGYGAHTIGGNLGWAISFFAIFAVASVLGWRWTLIASGSVGLVIAFLIVWQRHRFHDHRRPVTLHAAAMRRLRSSAAVLANRSIVLCLIYFTLLSTAMTGVQTFLPSTLLNLHGTPVEAGNHAVTAFLLGGPFGVVLGAMLANRQVRPDLVVCFGLAVSAALVVLVSGLALSAALLAVAMAVAGFHLGITTPSRDMMVRAAAPAGASGRVFGFVYSGLDIGGAVAPVTVGVLLDHQQARLSLWLTVAMLALAMLAILAVRRSRVAAAALQPAE
jgi:MFS transporter, FSR family, fosmidomycin resistance protein